MLFRRQCQERVLQSSTVTAVLAPSSAPHPCVQTRSICIAPTTVALSDTRPGHGVADEAAPPRRPRSEEDRLAEDITSLGKQRWEARVRGRLSVPAHVLSEGPSGGQPATKSSHAEDRADAARLAYKLSKVRPARPPRRTESAVESTLAAAIAEASTPWTPAYQMPPPLPDGSMASVTAASVSDIAFTLDEMEQSLFNSAETAVERLDGPVAAAPRPESSPAVSAADAPTARVATQDDASLQGPVPPADPPVPRVPHTPPAQPVASASASAAPVPVPRAAAQEGGQAPAEAAKQEPTNPSVPPPRPWFTSETLPCCFQAADGHAAIAPTAAALPPTGDALLSVRFDPSSNAYVVSPRQCIVTVEQLVSSLNGAMTYLERRHSDTHASLVPASHGPRDGRPHATNVMLHLSTATLDGWGGALRGTPVLLQPIESELSLTPLQRLRLSSRKEGLLRRIHAASAHCLRVIVVVGQGTLVADFTAELLLCTHDCYTVGSAGQFDIGFPSAAHGILPSPTTLVALRRRAERLMSNTQTKKGLLAFLTTPGPIAGLEYPVAPTLEEVVAAVVRRIVAAPADVWAGLGLLEPVPLQTTLRRAWWQTSLDRIRSMLRIRKEDGPEEVVVPVDARRRASLAERRYHSIEQASDDYCQAACRGTDACTDWQDRLMAVIDSPESHRLSTLYRASRESLSAVTFDCQRSFVHVRRANMPSTLSARELRAAITGGDAHPRVTVVLDADVSAAERDRLLAALTASDDTPSANDISVAMVGQPADLASAASLVPLAAFLTPVGRATGLAPLRVSRDVLLLGPALLFNSVFEVSLSCLPAAGAIPDPRTVSTQCGGIQFLQFAKKPFVVSATGEEGPRLVAALVRELCRARLAEPALPLAALLRAVAKRTGGSALAPILTTRTNLGALRRATTRLSRECADTPAVSESDVTTLVHQAVVGDEMGVAVSISTVDDSPFDLEAPPVTNGAQAREHVTDLADRVLLGLLDHCLAALLRGSLRNSADVNLLSVAALGLAPTTGGLLAVADKDASRRGLDEIMMNMELCAVQTGRVFPSLPLVRWMAANGLSFNQLDEVALRTARVALCK